MLTIAPVLAAPSASPIASPHADSSLASPDASSNSTYSKATPVAGATPVTSPTASPTSPTATPRSQAEAILGLTETAPSPGPSASVTIDGTDKAVTASLPITVSDTRGTGAGWNLQLAATPFSTGGSSPRTLPLNTLAITAGKSSCAGGICVAPVNTVTYPVAVPTGSPPPAPAKIFNAAGLSGTGKFTITLTLQVQVPATTLVGIYTSTLNLSILSGP